MDLTSASMDFFLDVAKGATEQKALLIYIYIYIYIEREPFPHLFHDLLMAELKHFLELLTLVIQPSSEGSVHPFLLTKKGKSCFFPKVKFTLISDF